MPGTALPGPTATRLIDGSIDQVALYLVLLFHNTVIRVVRRRHASPSRAITAFGGWGWGSAPQASECRRLIKRSQCRSSLGPAICKIAGPFNTVAVHQQTVFRGLFQRKIRSSSLGPAILQLAGPFNTVPPPHCVSRFPAKIGHHSVFCAFPSSTTVCFDCKLTGSCYLQKIAGP